MWQTLRYEILMSNKSIVNLKNFNYPSAAVNKKYVDDKFLPNLGGRMQEIIDMNNRNIIDIPNIRYSGSSAVNKKYVDDKTSKIIIYKDLHFKSVGRTTVWGQVSTVGFPFLPLSTPNPNSKTTITILSLSSDKDTRPSKQSGLLESTIKILMKYYADDSTTKSSGEVTIGIFKVSDF